MSNDRELRRALQIVTDQRDVALGFWEEERRKVAGLEEQVAALKSIARHRKKVIKRQEKVSNRCLSLCAQTLQRLLIKTSFLNQSYDKLATEVRKLSD
jgi:hypothetical protein